MRKISVGMSLLVGIYLMAACQAPAPSASGSGASVPSAMQTGQTASQLPTPAEAGATTAPTQTVALPATGDTAKPLFIGVVQTIGMSNDSAEKQTVSVGPTAFAYDLDNRTLLIHPTISIGSLKADVIVGLVTEVETPSVVYEKREVKLLPVQVRLLQILGADLQTGILNFTYDSKAYTLDPGQTLSFDQPGATATAASIRTVITNHGLLWGIQTMPNSGNQP